MGAKKIVNLNGKFIEADKPIMNTKNRLFRYGDGLFESIRMVNGQMPLLDLHYQRLTHGCELLKIKLDKKFDKDYFEKQIEELVKKRKISDNARIRLCIFRADGGYYLPTSHKAEYIIEAEGIDIQNFQFNEQGYTIDIYSEIEKAANTFSTFKSCNALLYVMATIFREEHKIDDCILLNWKSRVIESVNSNLFLVRSGEIYTPPVSEGCVAGVMREYVLKLAERNGISCHEIPMTLEELFNADEMFLSNAIQGIRWVKNYKIKEYGNTMAKKLSEMANRELFSA